ncbi:MAG: IS110 family RNA-guided transposase [Planctomycetota bacterium]|jgi:transposase
MQQDDALFVGLDYHQSGVQVCGMDGRGRVVLNRAVVNDIFEIGRVIRGMIGEPRIAIEACTGASDLADKLAMRFGWSVDLAHPGYVSRMRQQPDKTDFSDAHLLADLERVGYLPRVWLAPAATRELRRLVRYRQQLVGERRSIKQRIGALLRDQRAVTPPCRRWTLAWLLWLERGDGLGEHTRWIISRQLARLRSVQCEIDATEKRLAIVTKEDRIVTALMAMPGIGLVTACVLRAEVGRFDRFRTGKQLARFCGLSPRNVSSGIKQADGGLVKAASPLLRTTLIEAAHRLVRFQPRWKVMRDRFVDAGKPVPVAVAAVANRWVRWLFHQMTESTSLA